jgi:drug/metabolite transporter (DMT)-like permease
MEAPAQMPTTPDDRARLTGITLIVITACLFGSGPFFARVAYDAGMTPLPLLTWRFVFAALVGWLVVLATPAGRRSLATLRGRHIAMLVALGLLYVGNAGAYTAALETVPAGLVAIITYLFPALVAVVSIRYARRLEGRRPWLALALSLTGVALAVGGIPGDADVPVTGLLLALAGPVIYTVWIVAAARMRGERPTGSGGAVDDPPTMAGPEGGEVVDHGPDALATTALMTTVTALGAGILAAAVGSDPWPTSVPATAWPAVLGFGTFTTLAVLGFLAGTRRIGAARASILSTVEPVYTVVMAAILLGEVLTPIQAVGGALVVCSVILAESGRSRGAPESVRLSPVTADHATV